VKDCKGGEEDWMWRLGKELWMTREMGRQEYVGPGKDEVEWERERRCNEKHTT
jgi:hypothetical protein